MPTGQEATQGSQDHPTPAELVGFMRGDLPRAEARRVVRHLLTQCEKCHAVTREAWGLGDQRHLVEVDGRQEGAR